MPFGSYRPRQSTCTTSPRCHPRWPSRNVSSVLRWFPSWRVNTSARPSRGHMFCLVTVSTLQSPKLATWKRRPRRSPHQNLGVSREPPWAGPREDLCCAEPRVGPPPWVVGVPARGLPWGVPDTARAALEQDMSLKQREGASRLGERQEQRRKLERIKQLRRQKLKGGGEIKPDEHRLLAPPACTVLSS